MKIIMTGLVGIIILATAILLGIKEEPSDKEFMFFSQCTKMGGTPTYDENAVRGWVCSFSNQR